MNPLFQRLVDDFPEVFGTQLRPAPLTALSLVHATAGVPPTPSNIDRRRAFREVQPVDLYNAIRWPYMSDCSTYDHGGLQFNPTFPAGRLPRPVQPAPAE